MSLYAEVSTACEALAKRTALDILFPEDDILPQDDIEMYVSQRSIYKNFNLVAR